MHVPVIYTYDCNDNLTFTFRSMTLSVGVSKSKHVADVELTQNCVVVVTPHFKQALNSPCLNTLYGSFGSICFNHISVLLRIRRVGEGE